jgi:hypothetical protein
MAARNSSLDVLKRRVAELEAEIAACRRELLAARPPVKAVYVYNNNPVEITLPICGDLSLFLMKVENGQAMIFLNKNLDGQCTWERLLVAEEQR